MDLMDIVGLLVGVAAGYWGYRHFFVTGSAV